MFNLTCQQIRLEEKSTIISTHSQLHTLPWLLYSEPVFLLVSIHSQPCSPILSSLLITSHTPSLTDFFTYSYPCSISCRIYSQPVVLTNLSLLAASRAHYFLVYSEPAVLNLYSQPDILTALISLLTASRTYYLDVSIYSQCTH